MFVFYDSLVKKANCWITAVFYSCFSFSLLPPWNNKKPNEPFFNVHPWFIMKICHEALKFKQINYFTNNQYVNRKKFTTGKYSTDKYIRVIGQFLKNWTDGNKTMTDIMRISIYIICNTNYDNSLYRLFHVIPADAKIDESPTLKH